MELPSFDDPLLYFLLLAIGATLLPVWRSAKLRRYCYSLLPGRLAGTLWPLSEVGWRLVDQQRLRTNIGWSRRIADAELADALAWAYHFNPFWRPVADQAASFGTHLVWGRTRAGADAYFSHRANTIVVSTHLQRGSRTVIATVLSHEAYHAAFRHRSKPADQFQNEVEAFFWESCAWQNLPKDQEAHSFAARFDLVVAAEKEGRLVPFVLLNRAYQHSYLGDELVEP